MPEKIIKIIFITSKVNVKANNNQLTLTTMTKQKDYNVLLWVFFVSQGLTDNIDLMRASMFCMECCKENATVESVKESSGYRSCLYDLPDSMLTDQKIQEMIDWKL